MLYDPLVNNTIIATPADDQVPGERSVQRRFLSLARQLTSGLQWMTNHSRSKALDRMHRRSRRQPIALRAVRTAPSVRPSAATPGTTRLERAPPLSGPDPNLCSSIIRFVTGIRLRTPYGNRHGDRDAWTWPNRWLRLGIDEYCPNHPGCNACQALSQMFQCPTAAAHCSDLPGCGRGHSAKHSRAHHGREAHE
jgi:hypothetical protein